jgi:hypothetical protein
LRGRDFLMASPPRTCSFSHSRVKPDACRTADRIPQSSSARAVHDAEMAGRAASALVLQVIRRREAGPEGSAATWRGSGLLDNVVDQSGAAVGGSSQPFGQLLNIDTVAEDAAALTEPAVDECSRPARRARAWCSSRPPRCDPRGLSSRAGSTVVSTVAGTVAG